MYKKSNCLKFLYLFITAVLVTFSCTNLEPEREWNNPFHPTGTNYYPPTVSAKGDTTIGVNDALVLSADAKDNNGSVTSFCWSFNGGVHWDTVSSAAIYYKTYSPSESGVKSVWYKAIDNDGLHSNPDSFKVNVHIFAPDLKAVNDTALHQNAVVAITFKASDTNGTIIKYYWRNIQSDSGWTDSSTTPTASFSNPSGGPLQIVWAAMDNDHNSCMDTFTIIFNRGPRSPTLAGLQTNIPLSFLTFDFIELVGSIKLNFTANDSDGASDTLVYSLYLGQKDSLLNIVYSGKDTIYLAKNMHPGTIYSWKLKVKDLSGDSVESKGQFTTAQPPAGPDGMKLIRSRNNSFLMGQSGFANSEQPVHTVTFTNNFWIDSVEINRGDFYGILKITDLQTNKNKFPVTDISWNDAILYCNAKSKNKNLDTVYVYTSMTGEIGKQCLLQGLTINPKATGYRLPTEAEWEYCCRAQTSTLFYWGNNRPDFSKNGWINTNSESTVHESALKSPNIFGLYDMAGNVWEWCYDWYDSSYYASSPLESPSGPASGLERVVRGGSFINSDYFVQSGTRSKMPPDNRNNAVGFRTVLELK
jgi:formylglycine-generating enzyme required for sulfatase activity